jgi:Protein of unknown function (DUF4038)/Putative collagen-binding domain of a collagenase
MKWACTVLMLMIAMLFVPSVASAQHLVLPLKASANKRYLVDQNGTPFLLVADAAWNMMPALTPAEMATYMSRRAAQGFNAIMVPIIWNIAATTSSGGAAHDGTQPFTTGTTFATYDLSTPNTAYFAEIDAMINLAKTYNLVVMLNPLDNYTFLNQSGSGGTLQNNGATKTFNYGAYLGNRYKNFTNVIWFPGNDFQDWKTSSTDNNLAFQLMSGIKSADTNHLQTIELNYNFSYSNQDTTTLSSVLGLDMVYTYGGTYDEVLHAYNSSPTLPVFLGEANYEGENDTKGLPGPCNTYCIREENYWTMTSGATGVNYGAAHVYSFNDSWTSSINDPGAGQIQYLKAFFNGLPWWNLVPDTTHQVVTAGYGTYNASGLNIEQNNYCTTSWVAGSLAVIYCPGNTTPTGVLTLTVNMAKFNNPVIAQWYDPSNGTYSTISGSPFANVGSQNFSPSSLNNHDGNPDWVLVLNTAIRPSPPSQLTATVQ